MKSQKVIRIWLLTLFIAAVAVSSCSRHNSRLQSSDLNHRYHAGKISRELMLTQHQSRELEALFSNLEDKQAFARKGHNIMDMIMQELGSDQFDQESVEKAVSNYLSEVEVVSLKLVNDLSVFHNSLSEEQIATLVRQLTSKDLAHHRRHRL